LEGKKQKQRTPQGKNKTNDNDEQVLSSDLHGTAVALVATKANIDTQIKVTVGSTTISSPCK
jgi:hypothetical protein